MSDPTRNDGERGVTASSGSRLFGWEVPQESAGERLDRFLAARATGPEQGLSRTRLKSLIRDGHVRVAGRRVDDPALTVQRGDHVELSLPPPRAAKPVGQPMALRVVFEDAHLIVIDKPAGLVIHPAAGHEEGTLVNALIAHCGASLSGIGGVMRPGIVHRLDKDTSGLVVAAKTDAAHRGLAAIFADHGRSGSLVRAYRAFVWGVPERASGMIAAPLGRHPINREKMAVVCAERGRRAVTHYKLIETFEEAASLLECRLETGRTHQIRVHLAHIGHPLLGDTTYGAGFKSKVALLSKEAAAVLGKLGRQALHAGALGFIHPITGQELMFESWLPPELAALASALRRAAPRRIVDEG